MNAMSEAYPLKPGEEATFGRVKLLNASTQTKWFLVQRFSGGKYLVSCINNPGQQEPPNPLIKPEEYRDDGPVGN